MKLTIEKVDNGFIVCGDELHEVYSDKYDEDLELKTLQSMLYSILEHFGYYGSKHDHERLFIRIEKQNEDT